MADIPEEPSPPPVVLNGAKAHCKVNGSSLKEKTPMCLVNELARYNQIPHQYRLTHEDGPAHKKVFTVTLKLGNEEYQADGSSIKKAQHSAAQLALNSTTYKHPPEKSTKPVTSRRNITPTVELNALAMKRGEVTEYSFLEVPPYAQGNPDTAYHHHVRFRGRGRGVRGFRAFKRGFPHTRGGAGYMAYHVGPSPPYPDGTYRVLLKVSDREYTGSGSSPQSARHDAATQALKHMTELMSQDDEHGEGDETCPVCPSERKSPVSLVHEMALKRKLAVSFEVVEEKGQPHMRMYYTRCTVGNLVTMGEGNGKKISKGKAAELMLEELSRLPEVTENPKSRFKRRLAGGGNTNVKGARRKPGRNQKTSDENEAPPPPLEKSNKKNEPCYVQQLLAYQNSRGGSEPEYKLVETKLIPNSKKKEYTMQVTIGDKCTIAVSSNKKSAMRNAAQLMLIDLGQTLPKEASKKKAKKAATPADRKRTKKEPKTNGVAEIETNEVASNVSVETVVTLQPDAPVPSTPVGGAGGRQLAPGILLVSPPSASTPNPPAPLPPTPLSHPVDLDKTALIAKEYLTQGNSPTAEALTRRRKNRKQTPVLLTHPKDQLAFLAQISGFTVQYSDFPNPNSDLTVVFKVQSYIDFNCFYASV
ncbi:hypothetical protein M8J76_006653 [Diaphorina citri]|nr:hypothetical protein M8J76_006653 [Diaphorina citri]